MRRCLIFWLVAATVVLCLCPSLLATGNGDVWITVNGGGSENRAFICEPNFVEIRITNDAPLTAMSIGFSFTSAVGPLLFLPYGNKPDPPSTCYVQEFWDALGAFDLGGLQVTTTALPNAVLLSGVASSQPLPAHVTPRMCYALRFALAYPSHPAPSGFAVDNIFFPPSGTWTFTDSGGSYAPTFQGQQNSNQENPDAPPVWFEVLKRPCAPPYFTATPNAIEYHTHCSDFTFDFDAESGEKCPGQPPIVCYLASSGVIDTSTGWFTLSPPADCTPTDVTVTVYNGYCIDDHFDFVVHWINNEPTITNCPTTTGKVGVGGTYTYPFHVADSDPCDDSPFSVSPVGMPPTGAYAIDPQGNFTYAPNQTDNGSTFQFVIPATDKCQAADTCQITVAVTAPIVGDCDGSGAIDISDAVYLVTYIFAGGLPPNPPSVGDVDCSGLVDISDVVYLIAYIFASGPEPCSGLPPSGSLVGQSECKPLVKTDPADSIPSNQDCIEYLYDGYRSLLLKHVNGAFNCCARATAEISIVGNLITIVEQETFDTFPCPCLCLFDVDYQIIDLPPGQYTIEVSELYLRPEEEPLEFPVDLSGATSGRYCVTRESYPWVQ